jgi:hypothetical protein
MTLPWVSGLKVEPGAPWSIRTHFEIRCVSAGHVTLLRDTEPTLTLARESASDKARALGYDRYFELDVGENLADAEREDGVYLTTVQIKTVARAI